MKRLGPSCKIDVAASWIAFAFLTAASVTAALIRSRSPDRDFARRSAQFLLAREIAALSSMPFFNADFHESDHGFQLKSINAFSLGDRHRSGATLACLILR
jgi:hypothetical protein